MIIKNPNNIEKEKKKYEKLKKSLSEVRMVDPDKEESLKVVIDGLQLNSLNLHIHNCDLTDILKKKYKPKIEKITGLSKEITFLELTEKILAIVKWPYDSLRLWKENDFSDYASGIGNPTDEGYCDEIISKPIELDDDAIMFPMFLDNQTIVAEKKIIKQLKLPKLFTPEIHTKESWISSNYKFQEIHKKGNEQIEVIRMPRFKYNNTLFSSLGYALHNIDEIKKGQVVDEDEPGIISPSFYQANKIRIEISRLVADNYQFFDNVLQNTRFKTPKSYLKNLLSPEYSGEDIDIILSSIIRGYIIQVFDLINMRMLVYGKGYVERYGNPFRLQPKGYVKLIKWHNGEYDPINYSQELGVLSERYEPPFTTTYTIKTFDWMLSQTKYSSYPYRVCYFCKLKETEVKTFLRCSHCRLVYYCSKKCQKSDWVINHESVCYKVEHKICKKELIEEEKKCFAVMEEELEKRKKGLIGINMLRKKYDEISIDKSESDKEEFGSEIESESSDSDTEDHINQNCGYEGGNKGNGDIISLNDIG